MLPHPVNERQLSINNFCFRIVSNHGIARIYESITELLTAFIGKNSTYDRKNTDSKIIDFTHFKTFKQRLLAVEYMIFIRYYYQSAKTRALYESTDGPSGWPADNLAISDMLGDYHRTLSELNSWGYRQPRLPISQRFGFDPDPDPNQRYGTIAPTSSRNLVTRFWYNCSGVVRAHTLYVVKV